MNHLKKWDISEKHVLARPGHVSLETVFHSHLESVDDRTSYFFCML